MMGDIGPDYQRSKCILIWGASPRHNRPAAERDINIARSKGAKLICIDPRPPERLDLFKLDLPPADLWLRVRPGTDAALALGMIRITIAEELYDKNFVGRWCLGFEDLRAHVESFTPERVEEITWVPKEQILTAVRLYARNRPSCLHTRLGAGSQHINATQTVRAINIFNALIGDIDVPGGNLISSNLGGFRTPEMITQILRPPAEVEAKRIGAQTFPFLAGPREVSRYVMPQAHTPSAIRAMLRGEIRAFYVPGSNVVLMEGDSRSTWDALGNLDFMVVADFFLTPTAELADLVLPAAHWLEMGIPMRAYQVMGPRRYNHVLASRKVIEPRGECWDDRKIILELARRMGVNVPWQNPDDLNEWQMEETGVKFKEVQRRPHQMLSFPIHYKKYEKDGFPTPSGKIELHSSILAKTGYEPLPPYVEPPEGPVSTPALFAEYPLIAVTHRHVMYMHSEFRQLPSFRKVEPDPFIEIHPKTAGARGIGDGEWMWVERPGFREKIWGRARYVPELDLRVISVHVGWWFPEKPGPLHGAFESNINAIISSAPPYDPINGNHQARALLCRVGKEEKSSTGIPEREAIRKTG
jgi:thiosulfate reductase/polysulfide reductase chain A